MSAGNTARFFSLSICVVAVCACNPKAPTTPPPTQASGGGDAGGEPQESQTARPDAAPREARVEERTPGGSRATAIEVCLPRGQVAYLSRLRCVGGGAPRYERIGQDGYRNERDGDDDYRLSAQQVETRRALTDGERDLHPVDRFALVCPDTDARRHVYLDMYHCEDHALSDDVPSGFTLEPPSDAPAPDAATVSTPEK